VKLRIANKILCRALNTGRMPRGSTLLNAMRAFPVGKMRHPRRYWAAGLIAAFMRRGYSIDQQREILEAKALEAAYANN
jgi:hypothetical protein